ncbi:LysR family transcriptional regulator [Phytohabitans suffuscus]|uniref:LysR family transcriptional regulator n=1 Tax=Phytohabitans suffuscus TaxID=624315 RepID=A0A6F8YWH9_9ACTN|nr:LysR substrate-binding domain-containing protein [Phytohabitans suffuscus]BCB90414.1 LysR family transcriptional regulator [Phytohabitans suffuscus]
MTVQLQQLRYFVAVADERHFTRAATHLGVAQPTLSKQIHSLERDIGAPLLDRARGTVTLTPAGAALLPIARRVLADVETARREVQELVGLRRGRVRLGATPSLSTSLVARVLPRFRAAHPGIDLHLEQGGSQDLVRHLTEGGLDLALVIAPPHGIDPALRADPILREDLVVASATPLPASAGGVAIARLRDLPLVMFRKGYDLRDATLAACHAEGFEPAFAVEGGEMDAVLSFVAAGLGVAVVPSMVLAGHPALHSAPLAPPGIQRTVAIAERRGSAPTHAAAALRRAILAYLRD